MNGSGTCDHIFEEVDLARIDAHMTAHVEFLNKYYSSGNFLVLGRKIPRFT